MVAGHAHLCHASKPAASSRCRKRCITTVAFIVVLHSSDAKDKEEQQMRILPANLPFFGCFRVMFFLVYWLFSPQTCRAFAYVCEKHWSTWFLGAGGRVILGQGNKRPTWQTNNAVILSAGTKGACLVSLLACRPHPAAPLPLSCAQPLSLWFGSLSHLFHSEMNSNPLRVFPSLLNAQMEALDKLVCTYFTFLKCLIVLQSHPIKASHRGFVGI